MLQLAPAFAAGVLALQFCRDLPPAWSYWAIPLGLLLYRWRVMRPLAGVVVSLLAGFFWAALRAEIALDTTLPPALEGQTVVIEGRILQPPRHRGSERRQFLFAAEHLETASGVQAFHATVRLSLYSETPRLRAGERWRLAVRLKRPVGFMNPGGFDYEQWLYQQGIRATGYVRGRDGRNMRLATATGMPLSQLRWRLMVQFEALQDEVPRLQALSLVRAMTIGDRDSISEEQWAVLRSTGTSHLVAISGLHVSLVAGLVYWLGVRLATWLPGLSRNYPARKVAAWLAILAALHYAMLAGFTIPTRRALVMVIAAMLALLTDRDGSFARAIALAVFAVLLLDPAAILSAGWWLSFWAVATIAWCLAGRCGNRTLVQKWLQLHVVLAVALMPLLLLFFHEAPWLAPLANVIAVPFISLLVIPLALLGTLLGSLSAVAGKPLLLLSAWLLEQFWPWLAQLARFEQVLWHPLVPVTWALLPAMAALALLLVPRGVPGRWLSLLLLLPAVMAAPPRPAWGTAELTVLDVGQGLATVIRTHGHTLLFDAGPRYSPRFDTGSAVVLPFLRQAGIHRLDMLVVSHGDNDHRGGVPSILDRIPVRRLLSSVPGMLQPRQAQACRAGQQWSWDGVTFSMLHPAAHDPLQGNDASCVLRVASAGGQVALLTADIEAAAERRLLHRQAGELAAAVLVAPHHGSETSSTPAFVEAVSADVVLFPAGYRNRYGFPAAAVRARYRASGAQMYETGLSGALTVRLSSGTDAPIVRRQRSQRRRYWHVTMAPHRAVWPGE